MNSEPTINLASSLISIMSLCSNQERDHWYWDKWPHFHQNSAVLDNLPNGDSNPVIYIDQYLLLQPYILMMSIFCEIQRHISLKFTTGINCFITFHPHFCLFQDLWTETMMGFGVSKHVYITWFLILLFYLPSILRNVSLS